MRASTSSASGGSGGRSNPVCLRVYDISGGAARIWSPIVLGRRVEGVWHSGVEVFGYEYFYGGGIVKMRPENVENTFGIVPLKTHHLGSTNISRVEFENHLQAIKPMFKREVYDLVNWNCNHFSDHVSRHLLNRSIPAYILDLPNEIHSTFMGKIILNFIKMMHGGSAPIGIDDPEHPSKVLGERTRRSSCPAVATPGSKKPLKIGEDDMKSHRKSRVTFSEFPNCCQIAGGHIGKNQTVVLLSPKHKRLYELERDKYARGSLKPNAISRGRMPGRPKVRPNEDMRRKTEGSLLFSPILRV